MAKLFYFYGTTKKGIETMNFLEEKIVKEGVVKEGNILKVDSFLNHQMLNFLNRWVRILRSVLQISR